MRVTRAVRLVAGTASAVLIAGITSAAFAEPVGGGVYVPSPLSAKSAPMAQAGGGTVWALEYNRGVVYAGGSFSSMRPAGAPSGSQQTAQARLAAINSSTGAFISGWRPTVNGEVDAIEISPDGNRMYIGGTFTTVNGQTRNRLAAFDLTNPQAPTLLPTTAFNGRTNGKVYDITATDTTVYVAGGFTTANNVARTRVAAFTANGGALTNFEVSLTGSTDSDPGNTWAASISIGNGRAYIGGQFLNMDGIRTEGLAVVDATNGNPVTGFAYPDRADGQGGWITDTLLYDGRLYLVGRVPPARAGTRLEGIEALNPTTGAVIWGGDNHRCLGDAFNLIGWNGTVWMATHSHDCGQIGAYPEQDPRFSWHATVLGQDAATGEQVSFYPQVSGRPSVQGSLNNSRALATDGTNLFVGGGFLSVMGEGNQQNLIKFAPKTNGGDEPAQPARPTVTTAGGDATITWSGVFDRDDRDLTYAVLRRTSNTPLTTIAADSPWWREPVLTFTDTAVNPGDSVYYRVRVTDGTTTVTSGNSNTVTVQ